MVIPRDKFKELETFFKNIRRSTIEDYIDYWDTLIPITKKEVFDRWIFAAMSIHTGYENNVKQFNAIKDMKGTTKLSELSDRLKGGGMQNRKAKLVANICNTQAYTRLPNETTTWREWRIQMDNMLWGIGKAKISFVAEMLSPIATNIICLDRHILKAFGQDAETAPNHADYHHMEDIWNDMSRQSYCPPAIARFIYWDNHIQQQPNSKYWSKTLEK